LHNSKEKSLSLFAKDIIINFSPLFYIRKKMILEIIFIILSIITAIYGSPWIISKISTPFLPQVPPIINGCLAASALGTLFAYIVSVTSSYSSCHRPGWLHSLSISVMQGPLLASLAVLLYYYIPYITELYTSIAKGSSTFDPSKSPIRVLSLLLTLHFILLYLSVSFASVDSNCTLTSAEIAKEVSYLMKVYNKPADSASGNNNTRIVTD
jgi:hypothetical protein